MGTVVIHVSCCVLGELDTGLIKTTANDKRNINVGPMAYEKCITSFINALRGHVMVTVFLMTSSNGNTFRVTDHLCGEFTGTR